MLYYIYCTLYIISPLINIVINRIYEKQLLNRVVLILFALFSVRPTSVDVLNDVTGKTYDGLSTVGLYGSQHGYTIVNFILLYVISATVKK